MDEIGTASKTVRRTWLKRVGGALGILLLAFAIFHRPILLTIARRVAIHFAAKENLRLDCKLGGTIFTNLVVENLHVTPTGPSAVEAIDVGYFRVDYSLLDLARRGISEVLKNVEVRTANVVLDPSKAPPEPTLAKKSSSSLPTIFPERVLLSDINLTVRQQPRDLALQHFDLELDPQKPGALQIAKLQFPGADWQRISAKTSYAQKKLVLSDLALTNDYRFREIALDASQIPEKRLTISLDGAVAGGTILGSIVLQQTATSLETDVRLGLQEISLDKIRDSLGQPPNSLGGEVRRLAIDWNGELNAPRSWSGAVAAQIDDLRKDPVSFDRVALNLTVRDGVLKLDSGEATRGVNKIRLKGSANLPAKIGDLARSPALFEINALLPDLHSITASSPQPITGAATISGRAEINAGMLRTDLNFSGGPIGFTDGAIEQVSGRLSAKKEMPSANQPQPYFANLNSELHADLTSLRFQNYLLDSVHADLRTANDLATLERLVVSRKQNALTLSGVYRLPADFANAKTQPGSLNLSLGATELADFWSDDAPNKISGPLEISGGINFENAKANGSLQLFGANLRAQNLTIAQVNAQIAIAQNVIYLNDLRANLNERDFVVAHGNAVLGKPFRYDGSLSANIGDLATLKPLLAAAQNKSELAGTLAIDWNGHGEAADMKNSGSLKLKLERGRFANLQALQANIDATYSPDGLDVPTIFFGSDKMDFQAILQAKGSTIEVSKIQVDQGQAKYASGYISAPFIWKNLGTDRPLFPSDGKIAATFQSENLDLKKLFQDVGAQPIVSGLLNVKLDAGGTLANPTARFDLQMRELRSEKFAKLEPASFDLNAQLQGERLSLSGKFQQAKIQPVQITAEMPLSLSRIATERKIDDQTPITAKVQLPRSSLNFVRQFVPAINTLDGDMALDVNVNGTIAHPDLSGAADMTVNVARFANPTLPTLSSFRARLAFNRDRLDFERFGGDLAGGPFTLSGRIGFPKLTEPTFDLHLKADSVLLARNDALTARADMNIAVSGPLNAANVSGNVALTNSQFLKDIDLIPIGLPGRPAPQPPSSQPDISFPEPPLRDWKFDVAIKTKDPFLIRGNMANGGALVDLKLVGNGLHPGLQGVVRMQNVEATLPFSRLDVDSGFLYFDPSDSFNPKIDLHGTSLIRDYTMHVYVYGSVLSPEAVFTSEPPLPQEEIISLLATGTTREELTGAGSTNLLAGKAAMLVVQQLYRKVFKKGSTTKSNSIFDRLQVEVAQNDPRTGQQTATARYKLNDKVLLIGDIGVAGEFRGIVKYLIRFR